MNRRGRKIRKIALDMTANEALTLSRADFLANWNTYVDEFLED